MGDCIWVHFNRQIILTVLEMPVRKLSSRNMHKFKCIPTRSCIPKPSNTVGLSGKGHSLVFQRTDLTSFCNTVFQRLHWLCAAISIWEQLQLRSLKFCKFWIIWITPWITIQITSSFSITKNSPEQPFPQYYPVLEHLGVI